MHLLVEVIDGKEVLHAKVWADSLQAAERRFRSYPNLDLVLSRGGAVRPTTPTNGNTWPEDGRR
jgi:hypothetical protein